METIYEPFENIEPTQILAALLDKNNFESIEGESTLLVKLTAYFVSVNTQTTSEEEDPESAKGRSELINFCSDVFRAIGLSVKVETPYTYPFLIAETQSAKGQEFADIMFVGHLDTVEQGENTLSQVRLTHDKEKGFLAGRGVVDMKSQVAATIIAACKMYHQNPQVFSEKSLRFLITTDEEIGNIFSISSICNKLGLLMVDTEPTGNENNIAIGIAPIYSKITQDPSAYNSPDFHVIEYDGTYIVSTTQKVPRGEVDWKKIDGFLNQRNSRLFKLLQKLYGETETFPTEKGLLTHFDPKTNLLKYHFICTSVNIINHRIENRMLFDFLPYIIIASFAENHVRNSFRHSGFEAVDLNVLYKTMNFYYKLLQNDDIIRLLRTKSFF
ncbi:MAG: hypothetical protein Kow0081_4510 [Candidatus Dojkabacteria bacterium]